MALEARVAWVNMTNPFGGKKDDGKGGKPSADTVADKLRKALTGRKKE